MKINNKVIVWGIDNFNTLAMIRQIGQSGTDLFFLIKGSAGYACRSRYCTQYAETADVESGFQYLKEHFSDEPYKPIVLTCGDDIAVYLDNHRAELADRFILPVTTEIGYVEKYANKFNMLQLAQEIGISCPHTVLVGRDSEIPDIQYPCFLKPVGAVSHRYNEFKFKICKDRKHLQKTLQRVRADSVFLLQQFIKTEMDLLVYGARLPDGQTVFGGTLFVDRRSDTGSASHGYIQSGIPETVGEEKLIRFLDTIDYHGLFSFEFGIMDGTPYFYEVNLRNDGTSHFYWQAGANLPLIYVYACAGEDWQQIRPNVTDGQFFIDELFDYENVVNHTTKKKQWKEDLKAARSFKYSDPQDEEPYRIAKKGQKKQIIKDEIVKKYRPTIVWIFDRLGIKK